MAELQAVLVTGGFEPRRTVDEKERVVDVMVLGSPARKSRD
jgi:hypothetical protein